MLKFAMTGSCYSIHHLSFHSWLGKTLRNCAKIGLSKRDAALQKHIHFQAMPDWTLPGKLASATARQESVPEARIVSEFSIPGPVVASAYRSPIHCPNLIWFCVVPDSQMFAWIWLLHCLDRSKKKKKKNQ